MSYTEYSKELEAFISKQKRLLEVDKKRIKCVPQQGPNQQQRSTTPPEEPSNVAAKEVLTSQSIASNDKHSKEKVNSQISRKTNIVKEEGTGSRVRTGCRDQAVTASSIDSTNIDAPQDVVANLLSSSIEGPSTVSSAHRSKQLSPQQDEMEQWVSDTFFSYFPSFNKKQKEQKTVLSRTRQQEYQEYLKNIPEVTTKHQQYMQKYGTGKPPGTEATTNEKGTGTTSPPPAGASQPQVRFGKSLVAEANTNFRKGSPREKLIQDLAHTDLPTILNTDTIDRRNRMLADEESRRKMEYQKELIKQIEEKRKEVERLREKEKLEEEMLTSRLEQQLKTMQLEEQLEHERLRSEKVRIATEQNHIRRLQLLANLENDHKLFNPYDGQRKALSENGAKVVPPAKSVTTAHVPHPKNGGGSFSSGDERSKVYRYFSNSAQQDKQTHFVSVGAASSSTLSSEQDYESSSETTNNSLTGDHRYQYCKSCRADIDRSFLPPQPARGVEQTKQKRQHCAKCGCKRSTGQANLSRKDDHVVRCMKCDRSMKRPQGSKGLVALCAVCTLTTDADRKNMVHQKVHQEKRSTCNARHYSTIVDDDDEVQIHQAPVSPKNNPYKILDIQYHESDNDNGDLDVLNPVIVRNNYRKPPYSLNIEKDSLFHPSKKTPEPVLSVNIRNGEVYVDNKMRTSGVGGSTRPPVSPSDVDEGHRDDETSSATVGDDMLDERIAKYVRHYNTLWMKRGNSRKNNAHHNHHHQQHHHDGMKGSKSGTLLPSLSPPKVYVSDRPENLKSDALKLMEKKWEVPAVERTKVNEKGSTRVLTQLGAIRKQLQLEQLQMDDPTSYGKKY
ncbi:uncharacterized protein LOC128300958 isoform X2 [Anopheles moucheti]|uniref:uncharacterized protein LOC128300958 isoform X2 n=1 Tax=Anopheles moucheti TaxID=186751 RepID=UPI0022F06FE6|nr:uncharacterized protein LOC128300958 isoform X2 [Anopheles moucheti]